LRGPVLHAIGDRVEELSRGPYGLAVAARLEGDYDDQWRTLDVCAGTQVDRSNPDFAPFMSRQTAEGRGRACWNSWAAPHNFEGFFLNMGDMLVKAGQVDVAKKIYAQAKLSKQYGSWPHAQVLERRIAQADENVAMFRAPPKGEKERVMMVASGFSCMGCHQE
jgi:hypothetical protein